MNIERAIVSKVVSTGQLEEALARGIIPDHFADDECREMFSYLVDHTRRYKAPPSMAAVKDDKPNFEWEHVQDSLDYLVDRFIKLIKRRYASDAVVELAKLCDDPDRAENIDLDFLEVSRNLATIVPSTQVAKFSEMDKRYKEYERLEKEGKKVGIPTGFPTLDYWTGGIQPHEFVTISGFSGLGKSTLLWVTAFNMWVQGYTPLIISLEMESHALLRKFDAMAASLTYDKMKQMELPKAEKKRWREKIEEMKGKTHDIPIIDSIRHCTPDHVFAETVRYKPDIVMIDYLSLMRSSRPSHRNSSSVWQSLTEITQDLKQNARTLRIPILAAAQTNRGGNKEGAELDNIGYSISVVQDSDIVIGLFADDEMKNSKEMEIRLNKNRDGRLGRFQMIWDYESMSFREKTMNELYSRDNSS